MNQPAFRLLAAMLLVAVPAYAHHSPAQFDLSRDQILEGTLTAVSWRNPHIYFDLEIAAADGSVVRQRVEAGPASNMAPLGFDRASITVGERVVLQVKPNRSGAGTVLGWLLTKADGTAIPLHVRAIPQTEPGESAASGLAGTWVPQGTGFASLAVAARDWPLTDAGNAAVVATQEARDESRSACIPFGPPALMTLPSVVQVEVSDEEIRFTTDVMNAARTVHLNQQHPAQIEPSLHGHSVGHWVGETLVAETVGYAPHPDGYAFDLPSSGSKRIVERFRLSEDGRHIEYEAEVEDPEYLAETVTHKALWDYRPGQMPSNLPCDTEAASRFADEN